MGRSCMPGSPDSLEAHERVAAGADPRPRNGSRPSHGYLRIRNSSLCCKAARETAGHASRLCRLKGVSVRVRRGTEIVRNAKPLVEKRICHTSVLLDKLPQDPSLGTAHASLAPTTGAKGTTGSTAYVIKIRDAPGPWLDGGAAGAGLRDLRVAVRLPASPPAIGTEGTRRASSVARATRGAPRRARGRPAPLQHPTASPKQCHNPAQASSPTNAQ